MLPVLVGHSYFLKIDAKQRQRAKPYPPLATLQVAALLRQAGHEVSLFDAMLADGADDFAQALAESAARVVVFYEDNYNFLSKMCLGRMRRACCEMIGIARASGARVIAAGSDVSDAPEVYLAAGADVVLHGEGLATLQALIDRLAGDSSLSAPKLISGLKDAAALIDGEVERSGAIAPLAAPKLARRPAWDLVDIEAYRSVWQQAHDYFSLNMVASRGCSFRCNWCAKPIWGNRYLQRPADEVAAEMLYLKREFAVDHVWFADDIFGFRADWVESFAGEFAEQGGGVPFTIQLRADLVSESMASALARANCREVWLGAESGSQRILDAMNKGTTVESILRARRLFGEHGIRVGFFLMLGYLGETLEDLLATRSLVDAARPDDVGVSVAYPLPGTQFHEAVRQQLGDKRNWQESSDLEMMFAGTYRSEFYRLVRDLMHDHVADGWSDSLARRWNDLILSEAEYRSRPQEDSEKAPAVGAVS